MRDCLAEGASPDTTDSHGWPLLLAAAYDGRADLVDVLLKAGANLNPDHLRLTPLQLGCPYADVVDRLIRGGADVNLAPEGTTVLMSASIGGYLKSVVLLVDAGADLERTDPGVLTAADHARREGHDEIERFLRTKMRARPGP